MRDISKNLDTASLRFNMIDEEVSSVKELYFPSFPRETDDMKEIKAKLQLQEKQQKEEEEQAIRREKEERERKPKEKQKSQKRPKQIRKPGK